MESKSLFTMNRRSLLAGSGAVLGGLAMPGVLRAQERIVMPTFGGSYEAGLKAAIFEPFTRETGIEVVLSGVPDLAKLKAQVVSGATEWDVFDGAGSWFPTGSSQGLFEPLELPADDYGTDAADYALFYQFAFAITWNKDRIGNKAIPGTFKEIWDQNSFPGRWTFRNRVDMILEVALAANGVEPAKLYPLDIERGFQSLEAMKPNVGKWADATTQLTTLLTTGEVDFALNPNNRIKAAVDAGQPLAANFEQTFILNEYLAVPKNAPNKAGATKFIAFARRAETQARLANTTGHIPGNPNARDDVSPEIKLWHPDMSSGRHIVQDDKWWAVNSETLQKRFIEFLLI